MKQLLAAFLRDECGADMLEYSLIAAVVMLTVIAAASSLANSISQALLNVEVHMPHAPGPTIF